MTTDPRQRANEAYEAALAGANGAAGPAVDNPAPAGPTTDEAQAQDQGDGATTTDLSELTEEQLRDALSEALAELDTARAERDEYRNDLQRKAAELSNVLKREQRTAGVGRLEGRLDVLRVLLDVLDDFDRTREAAAASADEALRSGIHMVHDKLASVLAGQGLVRCGEVGDAFDPSHHEAIQQVEAEDGPLDQPVVHEVFRPGYRVGDRVVRPAMVIVRQ